MACVDHRDEGEMLVLMLLRCSLLRGEGHNGEPHRFVDAVIDG